MTLHWAERYGRWLVNHRGTVLLLLILVTALAAFGISERLKEGSPVDFTPQAMFMGDGDEWDRLQGYEAEFGVEDNTMVVLVDGPINSTAGLEVIQALHSATENLDGVEAIDSVINAAMAASDDGGMISVVDAVGSGAQPLTAAMNDRFLSPMLVASDGSAAVIQIHLEDSLQSIADLSPVVHSVTAAIRSISTPEGFTVHVTGVPFVRAEVVDMMGEDHEFFFPMVTVVFLVTIVALFGRFWLGLAPMVGVLVATVWTMGLLLSSGAVLNILSILTPTLVLVIGVADGIHVVSRYREELTHTTDRAQAMGITVRRMMLACFLTTFTTGAGFATLLVAETQVIRDFGLQVATGVMITFFAVMLVVPALLAWIPIDRIGRPNETVGRPIYARLTRVVTRNPGTIICAALAMTLIAAIAGHSVRTDSRLLEMYRPGHPTWQAVHLTEERTGGFIPIFIHLSGEPGQMLEPDVITRIDQLETTLQSLELTGTTASAASWVQHFHRLLTGEPGVPATREAVAQEILLAELTGDLPLERVLSTDNARSRIIAFTNDAGGREFLVAKRHLEARASELFSNTGIDVEVTGDGMLASDGVDQLIRDLIASLGLMLIVILLTMWMLMRDFRQTLIATVPNIVPLVFILGTLGLMGADLQTSNIISFTVAVGLAVDDTIHFIVRYREEKRRGASTDDAIGRTFLGAGHAIVLTSILLIVGFGILSFSSLTSTYFFGLLACITMAAAMIGDLLLLPALFKWFDRG